METNKRSEEQLRYIELNTKFLEEVGKGKTWQELQPMLDEMKELAKDIEDIEATNVFVMNPRKNEETG
jgi:hypothetical protein